MNFRATYEKLPTQPYREFSRVHVTLADGTTFIDEFMQKEEVMLCQFVETIRGKLTDEELSKLESLIDDYGSMKYREGDQDCERQHSYY